MEMFDPLCCDLYNNIDNSPDSFKLATLCWCAKETAFKSLQQVEVDFIEHLHILPFVLSDEGEMSLRETKTPLQQVFCINYQITDDYIITWNE